MCVWFVFSFAEVITIHFISFHAISILFNSIHSELFCLDDFGSNFRIWWFSIDSSDRVAVRCIRSSLSSSLTSSIAINCQNSFHSNSNWWWSGKFDFFYSFIPCWLTVVYIFIHELILHSFFAVVMSRREEVEQFNISYNYCTKDIRHNTEIHFSRA